MTQFVNPYNFIPFGEEPATGKRTKQEQYRSQETLKSGWIEVSLYTKTPLIIPDGAHPRYYDVEEKRYVAYPKDYEKKFLHKEYDFIKRTTDAEKEEYYIPGSSIRGMIRNVYEAATDSCVPFLLKDPKSPVSQRVPIYASLQNRGLLAYEVDATGKNVWRLYKAAVQLEQVNVRYYYEKVRRGKRELDKKCYEFCRSDGSIITEPTGSYIEEKGAYIQYNVPVNTRQPYHVAFLSKMELLYTWQDDAPYRQLKSILHRDGVKGGQVNPNEKPGQDLLDKLEEARQGKGNLIPVYYFTVTRKTEKGDQIIVYFSNSAVGRIAQHRTWSDVMDEHGPCRETELCPACLLFGNMTKEHGLKSRLRVSDAFPCKPLTREDLESVTLDVLGEPRTSAFEFYLDRPDYEGQPASLWNFDFFGVSGKDDNGNTYTNYYDLPHAMPRGRKMYWHGQPTASDRKTRINATVSAVRENQKFMFRIYYDEITEGQLKDLIWTITLGDNCEESNRQHKLGHAKPLGYGSVKLTVDHIVERTIQYEEQRGVRVALQERKAERRPQPAHIRLDSVPVQSILKITDADVTKEMLVRYPEKEGGKIYEWFRNNRKRADELCALPNILDSSIVNH